MGKERGLDELDLGFPGDLLKGLGCTVVCVAAIKSWWPWMCATHMSLPPPLHSHQPLPSMLTGASQPLHRDLARLLHSQPCVRLSSRIRSEEHTSELQSL